MRKLLAAALVVLVAAAAALLFWWWFAGSGAAIQCDDAGGIWNATAQQCLLGDLTVPGSPFSPPA